VEGRGGPGEAAGIDDREQGAPLFEGCARMLHEMEYIEKID